MCIDSGITPLRSSLLRACHRLRICYTWLTCLKISRKSSKQFSLQFSHTNLHFFCRTDHMRQYIVDHGYTVADIMDCSKGENHMCLIQMGSPEEAIKALAKLHNVNPEGYQTRNNAGLCFSFSGRKSTKSPNDD